MNVIYDRNAAEHLKSELALYEQQINSIVKEISNILSSKSFWTDEKRKIFDKHMQLINDNMSIISKAQDEMVSIYNQKIKELEML